MVTLDYKHILSERLECLPLLIVKFLAPFNVNTVFSQVFNRARCVVASFFLSHFLFTSCYFWLFWGRAEGMGKKNRKEEENISYWIRTILNWFLGPGPGPCIKLTLLRVLLDVLGRVSHLYFPCPRCCLLFQVAYTFLACPKNHGILFVSLHWGLPPCSYA